MIRQTERHLISIKFAVYCAGEARTREVAIKTRNTPPPLTKQSSPERGLEFYLGVLLFHP
jgi:hypothetical protein